MEIVNLMVDMDDAMWLFFITYIVRLKFTLRLFTEIIYFINLPNAD